MLCARTEKANLPNHTDKLAFALVMVHKTIPI